MRKAVSCTGHMFACRKTRMSIAGSFCLSSKATKGQKARMPAAMSAHGHQASSLNLRKVSPEVMSRSAIVRIENPIQSRLRPGSGSDSGTPNRMTKKTSVTAIAGTMRVGTTDC